MEDEKTKKADTEGEKTDKVISDTEEPLSLVDEAKKVRDEIKAENDRREKILKEEQKLEANKMLGGTVGGHVEVEVSPEEAKKKGAAEFFKGTELEKAILDEKK